jgi:hypothetical protein
MKPKLSWRRDPKAQGLARVTQGPRGWMLYYTRPDGNEDWVAAISHYPQGEKQVYVVVVKGYGLPYRNTLSASDRQPRKLWPLAEVNALKKNLRKWVSERIIE